MRSAGQRFRCFLPHDIFTKMQKPNFLPTGIQSYKNEMFGEIRTMMDEQGVTWFVGKDVAGVLGYSNTRDALNKHVVDDDRTTVAIRDTGSNYKSKAVIINESGLYALIFSSKLPQAQAFKHWVTSEVLPQIRRTGGYIPIRNARTGELLSDEELLERANEMIGRTLQELNAQSADCLTATQVARMWGMDVLSFNNLLANIGIQHRKGGRWQLAEELEGKGLAAVRYYFSYSLKGKARMRRYLVWTLEGIHFLNTAVYKVPRMLTKGVQLTFNF